MNMGISYSFETETLFSFSLFDTRSLFWCRSVLLHICENPSRMVISDKTSVVLTEFFSILSCKIRYEIWKIKIRDDYQRLYSLEKFRVRVSYELKSRPDRHCIFWRKVSSSSLFNCRYFSIIQFKGDNRKTLCDKIKCDRASQFAQEKRGWT